MLSATTTGLSAGVTIDTTPQEREPTSETETSSTVEAEAGVYEDAGFISREEFRIQPGDFIRYMKEDGIIYQGTVRRGQPVENNFNFYPGQEDDLVVALDFDDGAHVAPIPLQHVRRTQVVNARDRTAHGRPVETVSPDEILAVSPANAYDWYRIDETWDTETETPVEAKSE